MFMLKRLQTARGTTVISTPPLQTTNNQQLLHNLIAAVLDVAAVLLLLAFCCHYCGRTSLLYYLLTKLPCCLHQHPAKFSRGSSSNNYQANGNFDLALIKQSPSQILRLAERVNRETDRFFGVYHWYLIEGWH